MEVGQEAGGPPTVDGSPVAGQEPKKDVRQDDGRADDQSGGGDDSSTPTPVKGKDRRSSRSCSFTQQYTGDDEAGDDEEHIDTDVPTTEDGAACVEEHHQNDGAGP